MKPVTKVIDIDPLTRHVYFFRMVDWKVYLDAFKIETRATTRHKFRVTGRWNRVPAEPNTLSKPKVPMILAVDVLRTMRNRITFDIDD